MVFMKKFSSTILVITTAYSDRTDLVIGWNVKLGMSKNPKVLERVLQWLILMEMAVLSSSMAGRFLQIPRRASRTASFILSSPGN
jgi:hypothetical protein